MNEMSQDRNIANPNSPSKVKGNRPNGSIQNRIAAIAEVTGVSVTGTILTAVILQRIGPEFNIQAILNSGSAIDFVRVSFLLTIILLIQYTCLLFPAFLIGWWHRRRSLKSYGLTTYSHSVADLVKLGVGTFALAFFPTTLLRIAREYLPLGRLPITQDFASNLAWSNWGFWLFMFVGSFGLVAILEEIFFRGYIQTRLSEDFDGPSAILITSALFMFSHVQYLYFGFFGIGNIIVGILAPIGLGYLYYRTKSLIPSILMHAIINIPVRGTGLWIMPAVMLILMILYRRLMWESVKNFWQEIMESGSKKTTIVSILYGAVFASLVGFQVAPALIFGMISLPVSLILEYREKRKLSQLAIEVGS